MRIFSKIFKNIVLVLTIAAVVLCVGLMGPKLFGLMPCIAQSGSMEPTVPTGSLVYINTRDKSVAINDIVTYQAFNEKKQTEALVTHRVIGMEDGNYITKGDANDDPDIKTVSPEQIYGKYAYHLPLLGFAFDGLGKKGLIVIAAWIIILNGLSIILSWAFEKNTKKGEGKKEETNEKVVQTEIAEAPAAAKS